MTPIDYDNLIIRPRDAMLAGGCVSGMRDWFEAHGLADRFREFLKVGLPASVILAPGDEYGRRTVDAKVKRENLNG